MDCCPMASQRQALQLTRCNARFSARLHTGWVGFASYCIENMAVWERTRLLKLPAWRGRLPYMFGGK